MTESSTDLGNIPPIWGSQIWQSGIQNIKTPQKNDVSLFDNAPNDVTLGSFFGKIFIWAIVWICVAALLFATLSAIWWMTNSDDSSMNSMLPILLPIIWFVVGFVWNLALAWLYNIFFSKRYYNFGKMFWLIFASSLIIFIFFFLIYLLFSEMASLYTVLWFQIIFWLYISLNLIDFLSQPNYSASSMMGNTLWCVLSVVTFLGIIKTIGWASSGIILPIIISSVIPYAVMILWSGIWDGIYYKFYEWWNNPFYLPSLNELREERQKEESEKAKDEEEVNVEIK